MLPENVLEPINAQMLGGWLDRGHQVLVDRGGRHVGVGSGERLARQVHGLRQQGDQGARLSPPERSTTSTPATGWSPNASFGPAADRVARKRKRLRVGVQQSQAEPDRPLGRPEVSSAWRGREDAGPRHPPAGGPRPESRGAPPRCPHRPGRHRRHPALAQGGHPLHVALEEVAGPRHDEHAAGPPRPGPPREPGLAEELRDRHGARDVAGPRALRQADNDRLTGPKDLWLMRPPV